MLYTCKRSKTITLHTCENGNDIYKDSPLNGGCVFTTVDREIFVLKIFRALKFHGAKFS